MATSVEYFLNLVSPKGGGGSGSGGGSSGGGDGLLKVVGKGNQDVKNELAKGNKGAKKGLGATLGIKFGIASLLKQSQVFTGFIGTIFQLMGALVDVILAPFLPILIPGIRLIASLIPYVSKYAQAIYDYLDRTIFAWFEGLGWSEGVGTAVKKALSAILVGVVLLKVTGLWNVFKSLVSNFIAKPLWGIAKGFFKLAVWDTLKLKLMMLGDTVRNGVKAALRAAWDWTGGKVVTGISNAWKAIKLGVWDNGLKPIITSIKTRFASLLDDGLSGLITKLRANLIDPLFTKIGSWADFIANPFKSLWKAIAGDVAATGDSFLGAFFKRLGALPVVGKLMTWLGKDLVGKIGGLFKGAAKLAGRAAGAVGGAVADIPGASMVGSMAKKLSPSALKNVAQGFKAIPVLGAVAELGFGAWATYKDYKKYGVKAAAGRYALTLGNTVGAFFDPTGVASAAGSIGSNIAMDQVYKRTLDPKDSWKKDNPDLWIRYEDTNGVEQYRKRETKGMNDAVGLGQSMPTDRVFGDE
jgi:hypothetical protein